MLMTTLALLAATATVTGTDTAAVPAPPVTPSAIGPITADYDRDSGTLCIRSGWNSASFATSRMIRRGECRTVTDWNSRNIVFDVAPAREPRRAPDRVAAR